MKILHLWRKSLHFFNLQNIKLFSREVCSLLPRIYSNWLRYCGWALMGALSVPLVFHAMLRNGIFFAPVIRNNVVYINESSHQAVFFFLIKIIVVGLLSYYAFALYVIIKQCIEKKPSIRLRNSMRHGLIGSSLLVPVFWLFVDKVYGYFLNVIYGIYKTRAEDTLYLSRTLSGEGESSIPFCSISLIEQKRVLLYSLVMINNCVALAMLVWAIFFLRGNSSVSHLFKSIYKALYCMLINLPALLILYCIVGLCVWPLGILMAPVVLDRFNCTETVPIVMSITVVGVLLLPLCATIYACYVYTIFRLE